MTASFDTSVALKNAGFPQPEPKAGQFWWFEWMGEPLCPYVINFVGTDEIFFSPVGGVVTEKKHLGASLKKDVWPRVPRVFAPQAHDIKAIDENPHESAAKAFLKLQSKTT